MDDSLVQPIPNEKQPARGWRVELNGAPFEGSVSQLALRSRFGDLVYGLTPHGHDGWAFHEHGGGGAVVAPWVRFEGVLHVGVIEQSRPLQGGVVLNVPRGFADVDENKAQAARREIAEEMGLRLGDRPLVDLGGAPGNPNSTFFDTHAADEGVRFFAIQLLPAEVERVKGILQPRADLILQDHEHQLSRAQEAIERTRFLPWFEVAHLGDLFSVSAVARLLAWLSAADAASL